MIVTLFVVFALASSALGVCPTPPTASSPDFDKIIGRWYQIAGPAYTDSPQNSACFTYDFTNREDGDSLNVTILANLPDGSKYSEYDLADRVENQDFLTLWSITTPLALSFYIADTDYDNYLAAYTCSVSGPSNTEFGLILSRTNSMSADKYAELTDLLVNKIGVSGNSVQPTIQKDCKYWPVSQ